MQSHLEFYINGEWVKPNNAIKHAIINPATEEEIAEISLGNAIDVDNAVAAAKAAFETYSLTSREYRIALFEKIIAIYTNRLDEMAEAISIEMGAPLWKAKRAQAPSGMAHFMEALKVLKSYEFEGDIGNSKFIKEPIGVCGLITPWNWPINQIACKVAPALAVGCTMVLKPSELAPLDAILFAKILHEAGVPKGVFNLVNGDGLGVGVPLSKHKDVDFISFTGSTRAGIEIAKNAAETVKRVAQELGGKSPNIILPSANLEKAVQISLDECFGNSGQSCNAPTRLFVQREKLQEVKNLAVEIGSKIKCGFGDSEKGTLGPIANKRQYEKVQDLIQKGLDNGLELILGGTGLPNGFNRGYFTKPTIFISPDNNSILAREEVFGPVLTIIPYDTIDDAVNMANDTVYGLSAYIQGEESEAWKIAKKLRAGMVHINGADTDIGAPFGGYKQSGTGREWGKFGFDEFLETKAIMLDSPKLKAKSKLLDLPITWFFIKAFNNFKLIINNKNT